MYEYWMSISKLTTTMVVVAIATSTVAIMSLNEMIVSYFTCISFLNFTVLMSTIRAWSIWQWNPAEKIRQMIEVCLLANESHNRTHKNEYNVWIEEWERE